KQPGKMALAGKAPAHCDLDHTGPDCARFGELLEASFQPRLSDEGRYAAERPKQPVQSSPRASELAAQVCGREVLCGEVALDVGADRIEQVRFQDLRLTGPIPGESARHGAEHGLSDVLVLVCRCTMQCVPHAEQMMAENAAYRGAG